MRPVHICDLDAGVRALLVVPPAAQPARARQIVADADTADRYRKRTGRLWRDYGPGTLAGAAARWGRSAAPAFCDARYRAALAVLLAALADRAAHRAA